MHDLRHASLLALFLITTLLFGWAYASGNQGVFIAAIVSLTLLFLAPLFLKLSFDENDTQKDAALEAELAKARVLAAQQRESGKLLIRRDLELSRANDQLRALDQLKTDFVTIATHQLRTPLTAIRWILSMLLRGDMGSINDEQKTYLMKAYESNNRMVALLGDMSASEKVTAEKLKTGTLEYSMFPDLADNVLTEIQPLAQKRGVSLLFADRKDSYLPAKIDPKNMRAILQNLLENAIKYTNTGGTVTFSVRDQDDTIVLAVADTGIGIPEEQKKNIFKRFFRAQNAVRLETDGSGLGLFIVLSIVERFKGQISFESTEGKGTTFRVVLPAAASAKKMLS